MKKLTGNSLNDLAIKAAKPKAQSYTLRDGDGLFLLVHPNGSKYFQLRTTLHNKRKLIQLPASLENFDQLPNSAYVRLPVVKGLYAYSKSTVYRNIKKGRIGEGGLPTNGEKINQQEKSQYF